MSEVTLYRYCGEVGGKGDVCVTKRSKVPKYRGTLPIKKLLPVGPYSNPRPEALWWS